MITNRLKTLAILFSVLLLIIVVALLDRMVIHSDRYLNTRYTDKGFVELMDSLIDDAIFTKNGENITINEAKLNSRIRNDATRSRVRKALGTLYIGKDGRICFDRRVVSIVNNRPADGVPIARGRFFDRNGLLLVENNIDERNWKNARRYLYGPEFFPIIGHDTPIFGKRHLENVLDDYLLGKRHRPVYRNTSDPFKKMELGDDVTLTLDATVQKRAYSLLGAMRGAVVVLDIRSGEIVGAVSTPSFDPNTAKKDAWDKAFLDKLAKPCENRAFSVLYPPGSTFKTVVAAAWLEQQEKTPKDSNFSVFCNGGKNSLNISDIHSHGRVSLSNAFAESCNLYFSQVGVMLGDQMLDYAQRFGFNRQWNLLPRLEGHDFTTTASRAFMKKTMLNEKKPFDASDFNRNPKLIAQGAIGQNLIMATPLQMAVVAATVANSGVLMNPYLVKCIKDGDGKTLFSAVPDSGTRVIKEASASRMKELMALVMLRGTGKDVKKMYYEAGKFTTAQQGKKGLLVKIAGKTGTSETGATNKLPHSWFIGYAPADKPRYAIAVIAENQGFGSLTAAPIAVDVLAAALNAAR
jgi:penicillin-binding protein A